MSDNLVMLSGRVPEELRDLVNADPRDNQEVLQSALRREYGGTHKAAIQRRIEEKERRISNLESEKNEREREISEERDAKKRLEKKLDNWQHYQQKKYEEAADALEGVPKKPDNPGVQNWAEKLEVTPEELIDRLEELD